MNLQTKRSRAAYGRGSIAVRLMMPPLSRRYSPPHHYDVPVTGEPFPDVNPRSWLYDADWGRRERDLPSSRRFKVWSRQGPMSAEEASRFVETTGHDFAVGGRQDEWLGANASEALDLCGHAPAYDHLSAERIVVPGARVFADGQVKVLVLTLSGSADISRPPFTFEPLDAPFPAGTRFLFVRVARG